MEIFSVYNNPVSWISTTVVLLLTTLWFLLRRRRRRSPPGPGWWPIPWLQFHWSSAPAVKCSQWADKYGDVFSVRLGTKQVVVLSGAKVARESFVSNESVFSGRPDSWPFKRLNRSLALSTRDYDKIWKRQRAFTLSVHRNFGVDNNLNLDDVIREEVTHFTDAIGKIQGEAFRLDKYTMKAAVNVLGAILFDSRFDYEDAKLEELVQTLTELHTLLKKSDTMFTYMPFSWHLLWCRRRRLRRSYARLLNALSVLAQEKEQTTGTQKMRHALDMYTREVAIQEGGERSIFEGDDDPKESLRHMLAEYFYLGAVPIAKTIETLFTQMVNRPEVQKRVRKEIREMRFLNGHRTPTVEDIENSHFSYATILEVLRLNPLEPLGWPRCATQPGEIDGYAIGRGTVILANTQAIHRDPQFWKDPEEFNPERFIDRSAGKVIENAAFMPWSVGPRKCPGEMVSRLVVWSFFASVMQKYQLLAPVEKDRTRGFLNGLNVFNRGRKAGTRTSKICAVSHEDEDRLDNNLNHKDQLEKM
ncbi:cytochrome P450 2J2-like [Ptychodera flava]|uniref:cytochrome P450 2J2-like n=1 Tax=Ptychodera flava TaxID=63121 RepID=UPI00396A5B04